MRSPSGVASRKTAISLQIGHKGYDPPVYGCPLSDQRRPGRTSDHDNERLQDGDLREVEGLLARSIGKNAGKVARSEEHTSALQSLMRISYAAFCLKKKLQ